MTPPDVGVYNIVPYLNITFFELVQHYPLELWNFDFNPDKHVPFHQGLYFSGSRAAVLRTNQ